MRPIVSSIAAALLILLSGCGPAKQKLFIYNWTYYIPDSVVKDFEKEFGVEVVYATYPSNEEMFTKLKAGGSGYDIVFPSGDYVSIMVKEGMIYEIDKSKIANLKHLDTTVLKKINFDPGSRYSVPYIMGAAGVSVNKKEIQGYDRSWSLFADPKLTGRLTLLDDMREVLGAALKYRGYSVNSTDPAQLEEAKKVVLQWKDQIVKFDAEAFGKGFAAGEFWGVHGYAENVFLELDSSARGDVDFFIPKEGSAMYMDNMVILKNAKNKDLAYTFINYVHRPEVYAQIVDFLQLPSINVAAREFRKVKPNYEIEDLANSEFKEDLGENLALYDKVWQEIRIGE